MTDSQLPPPASTAKPDATSQAKLVSAPEKHWLVRPRTIRLLWVIFIIILAGTVAVQFYVHVHAEFGIDGTFGFNAWYGLGACVVLIVFAKLLSVFIKRNDTYYGDQ